jgi:hypothetical protein
MTRVFGIGGRMERTFTKIVYKSYKVKPIAPTEMSPSLRTMTALATHAERSLPTPFLRCLRSNNRA